MSNQFEYTYSAPTAEERKEIESIRNQYLDNGKAQTKLERLRSLHFKVNSTATVAGLVIGIIGALIFGLGLTCFLEWNLIIPGVILSVVGCIIATPAYFIYSYLLKKNKEKYGAEILSLTEEMLGEEEK